LTKPSCTLIPGASKRNGPTTARARTNILPPAAVERPIFLSNGSIGARPTTKLAGALPHDLTLFQKNRACPERQGQSVVWLPAREISSATDIPTFSIKFFGSALRSDNPTSTLTVELRHELSQSALRPNAETSLSHNLTAPEPFCLRNLRRIRRRSASFVPCYRTLYAETLPDDAAMFLRKAEAVRRSPARVPLIHDPLASLPT